jgi:hypothetical protein
MFRESKSVVLIVLATAVLGAMVAAQIAGATHPRPKGASPLRVSLVPAYKQCTGTGNRTHGAPLAFPSCAPPVQASSYLTVGTPDANGAAANSIGSMTLKVQASTASALITGRITDVRCRPGTDSSVCDSPNGADGPDYSGQLQSNATIRISDHDNGPSLTEAATVQDIPFPVNFNCVNTADTTTGGVCTVPTDQPLMPYPQSTTPPRAVIEIGQFEVFDGGADGLAGTTSDNTVFMRQGIFIP